ncbi:nickel pincer cofactor biosynthesis protein LarC [Desulfoprunum benzoelyticum]|uniref:Putative nickel insertion protein n=1 Tax=Desulfoprunum benzoelyticum TaxID=1506996 RepID=A0A840V2J8_9BACT|nr:nickel pincer cofactor biosynthesis protein LarC [Desulfoprunum benzoelyticum]MBB5347371.1 hypothetical protein [Desulfoprunum benzoelyticum]MBM9530950.1 nickel pincer cofactor biosynthesis protein LarC [Desulfoprunum benzoelyticum]
MPPTATIAYLDCFAGISGDMVLAALIDAGLPPEVLRRGVDRLGLGPVDLDIQTTRQQGLRAVRVQVGGGGDQPLRTLADLLAILHRSGLAAEITAPAGRVFHLLAEAEAKVHGTSIDTVHFHEIGAVDTVVDVVGAMIGLHHLGIGELVSSPVPLGHGFIDCAHGRLPLPAPAVCELLRQVPVYGIDCTTETVTPTGAALLKSLATGFGPMPPMTIAATGCGAGSRPLAGNRPNLLRLIVGTQRPVAEAQRVEIIETNLDDWSPEGFPYLSELLLASGALDVNIAPIQMKKGRPAFRLQVICDPVHGDVIKAAILSETTAIGLRFRTEERLTLGREPVMVATRWGSVAAKRVMRPSGAEICPEYEECRRIAADHQVPLPEVYREVLRAGEEKPR